MPPATCPGRPPLAGRAVSEGAAVVDQGADRRQRREQDGGWRPSPPHLSQIATRRADEFHAWITAHYADHKRRMRVHGQEFAFFAESAALGGLTAARTTCRAVTAEIRWPPWPCVAACHVWSGRHILRCNGGEFRLTGQGTLLLPSNGFVYLHDCSESSTVTLSLDTLLRVAAEASGLAPAQVRFTGVLPVSPAAERQWLATAHYIRNGLYNFFLNQPLLLAAAEQMVASSLLRTFPNTTMTTEVRVPRHRAHATMVRRAVAFIDAHAAHPITLTDIATAVGVVPRTLQDAFRRHRDTTPLVHLRRVRLARARAELKAAQPGDGTTVAAVAARWGYARPYRFAAAYRRAYGQPPTQTLHY